MPNLDANTNVRVVKMKAIVADLQAMAAQSVDMRETRYLVDAIRVLSNLTGDGMSGRQHRDMVRGTQQRIAQGRGQGQDQVG